MNLVTICLEFNIDNASFVDDSFDKLSKILNQVYIFKKEIGDFSGLIKTLYLFGRVYLLENEPEEALQSFTEMAIEINKLATTVNEDLYKLPTRIFGMIIIDNLLDDAKLFIEKYRNHKSVASDNFGSAIKKILKEHSYGDYKILLHKMISDDNVKRTFSILNGEITR